MAKLSGEELRRTRTRMKMIFQDPISSLNPRRKVEDIIAEGLRIWKVGTDEEQQKKIDEMMLAVGLDPVLQRGRRPHQFSGGQCQRISIARRGHHRAEADHLRRAGLGARRVGAGADPEPARGDEGALRAHADLHRARPRGREERERPGRRDVPRQDLRGRLARRHLPAARAPVHAGAARRDPGARPERPARGAGQGRSARSRRRSRRRRVAGSAPAARRRRRSAPTRSRRSPRSRPASSSRATSRSRRARRCRRATATASG